MVTDEQLVARAQDGDSAAMDEIVTRYERVVVYVVIGLYDNSAERDDLKQEARIGVFKAVRDFKPGVGASFASFAFLCVRRQVYTAIKTATRHKHETLTWASRSAVNDHGDEIASADTFEDIRADTVEILAQRAQLQALVQAIANDLSPLERESIIGLVFLDETYLETEARILAFDGDRPGRAAYSKAKVVDNALSRARRKLGRALDEGPDVPLGRAA